MTSNSFRRVSAFIAAVALSFSAHSAHAGGDPHAVLAKFTQGLSGLSGQFHQTVIDANAQVTEDSRGTLALSVPRQFRWQYEAPFPQLIVADGNKVWIYDPDLEQVQVRSQGAEEQQSPLSALIDPGELDRQFTLSDGGQEEGFDWVVLVPKSEDAPFSKARLGFAHAELVRMEMTDALGQKTVVRFSSWQRNPQFDAATFRFVPPPGVDVIGDSSDAAQAFPIED
ncbi:MAG: outer membrane lipoprotein chaperone LolA [Xanthomonadales bacterium]|nr:outer membrane lipoprotein chaperone LolA [Xanthomonadales bacterium]